MGEVRARTHSRRAAGTYEQLAGSPAESRGKGKCSQVRGKALRRESPMTNGQNQSEGEAKEGEAHAPLAGPRPFNPAASSGAREALWVIRSHIKTVEGSGERERTHANALVAIGDRCPTRVREKREAHGTAGGSCSRPPNPMPGERYFGSVGFI